jgi:hypothetical protein
MGSECQIRFTSGYDLIGQEIEVRAKLLFRVRTGS